MIVVNEIHDFEEIPPQVQYFVVFGSTKDGRQIAARLFVCRARWGRVLLPGAGITGRRERRVAGLLPATYDSFCVITGNEYL